MRAKLGCTRLLAQPGKALPGLRGDAIFTCNAGGQAQQIQREDPMSTPDRDKPRGTSPARAGVGVPPAQAAQGQPPAVTSTDREVADFVARLRSLAPQAPAGRGRLVFAMDATMSRQPTWDIALALQAEMFSAVKEVGGLDVQLVFFRGAGECRASRWVSDPDALARLMTTVDCRGGYTQIGKALAHARQEAEQRKVDALVYVGDCMEESGDELCGRAGELALLGVPVFLFQEGGNARAAQAFREIARITRGAYCRFDAGSAQQLRELLTAVAVYAAGGRKALATLSDRARERGARLLLEQLK